MKKSTARSRTESLSTSKHNQLKTATSNELSSYRRSASSTSNHTQTKNPGKPAGNRRLRSPGGCLYRASNPTTVSSTCRITIFSLMVLSCRPRIRIRPSTITVSTSAPVAEYARWAATSVRGQRWGLRKSTRIRIRFHARAQHPHIFKSQSARTVDSGHFQSLICRDCPGVRRTSLCINSSSASPESCQVVVAGRAVGTKRNQDPAASISGTLAAPLASFILLSGLWATPTRDGPGSLYPRHQTTQ